MAFRIMDFGITNFDTNVEYLYAQAVEHGESMRFGDVEYIRYVVNDTKLAIVLRFTFEADGETPKEVVAHTFLDNNVRWQEQIEYTEEGSVSVRLADQLLPAELINPEAEGEKYAPLLYADKIRFGDTLGDVGAPNDAVVGAIVPNEQSEVALCARVLDITPILMSKLWLYSIVRLSLEKGTIVVPVCRDIMEDQLMVANKGGLCYLRGQLTLQKEWQ